MNPVLLSGGSGKRLWPLSNDIQSKQFLKLIKNIHGEYESMVQRVVGQLTATHTDVSVYVSCNISQEDIIKKQLGEIKTILEPFARDTFPAIALAAAYLFYNAGVGENDVFVTCPIDVFAETEYFEKLADVEALVKTGGYAIGLLGAKPTYASSKYGYILHENGAVSGFTEKPSESEAQSLIDRDALWNCGVFALKVGYVLNLTRKIVGFDSYESLYKQYGELPKISFDYAVAEKENSIGVVLYDGVWKDLGTWNTLTEEVSSNAVGSNIISENSENTHVFNMLDVPIIVNDVSDAVVIASHDGILVSSKHASSFLKPLAEKVELRPMYGQMSWGNYRILEYKSHGQMIRRVSVDAGETFEETSAGEAVWIIVAGKGIVVVNDTETVASVGCSLNISPGNNCVLLASTKVEFIEVRFRNLLSHQEVW